MTKCANCCVPLENLSRIFNLEILNTTPPVPVVFALNYIYKTSGKQMAEYSEDSSERRRLCVQCLAIAFELYQLHQKFTALTNTKSAINQTFQVIDDDDNVKSDFNANSIIKKEFDVTLTPDVSKSISNNVNNEPEPNIKSEPEEMQVEFNGVEDENEFQNMDTTSDMSENSNSQIPEIYNPESFETSGIGSHSYNRYSGLCSAPNCIHVFKESRKLDVIRHFTKVHDRTLSFVTRCHICEKILTSRSPQHQLQHFRGRNHKIRHEADVDFMFKKCTEFNDSFLLTNCGLKLRRDEAKIDPDTVVESLCAVAPNEDEESKSIPLYCLLAADVDALNNSEPVAGPEKPRLIWNEAHESHFCPKCDKVFRTRSGANSHIRIHHSGFIPYITCPICSKKLKGSCRLSRHLETHMNPQELALKKALKCPECGKVFMKKSRLAIHEGTHLAPELRQRLVCKEPGCMYSCLDPSTLSRHKKAVHSGKAPKSRFTCNRCCRGFTLWKTLRIHQSHCYEPSQKVLVCCKCEKRFNYKFVLESHYRNYHKMSSRMARSLVSPKHAAKSTSKSKPKTLKQCQDSSVSLTTGHEKSVNSNETPDVIDEVSFKVKLEPLESALVDIPEIDDIEIPEIKTEIQSEYIVPDDQIVEGYEVPGEVGPTRLDDLLTLVPLAETYKSTNDLGSKAQSSCKLRYSGSCSVLNCDHQFLHSARIHIFRHFDLVHHRKIKYLHPCHLCGRPVEWKTRKLQHLQNHHYDSGDPEALLQDWIQFNKSILTSKCGLKLYLDP